MKQIKMKSGKTILNGGSTILEKLITFSRLFFFENTPYVVSYHSYFRKGAFGSNGGNEYKYKKGNERERLGKPFDM